MFRWLRNLFQRPAAVAGSISGQEAAIQLLQHMQQEIASPGKAEAVATRIKDFQKLSGEERLLQLPAIYLFAEQYLIEGKTRPEEVRDKFGRLVRFSFPVLLEDSQFKLIFESNDRQQLLLCQRFLVRVLERTVNILGAGGNNMYLELRDSMLGLPDTPWDTIPTMLRGQLPKPASDKDWTTSLQTISLTLHNALGRVTGEGMVDEFYRKAYDRLADRYKALRSFPVVIGMIPDHLIDESKIGMLNRSQVEEVLFEKVEDLQKVNQWVMEKNHELEEARKDLMAAKEEVVQSANHITTILESVGEGIITVNESGHITVVNSEVSAIWGYRKAELTGKSIGLLIPELEAPAQAMADGAPSAEEAPVEKRVEMVGRRNNGEDFPVEVTVSYTTFGQENLRVFVARDITSRKQDELRTRELMTELKSVNGELQEYAHVVSHDLKAPLRGIGTLANWIRDDYGDLLGAEGKEHCDQMVVRVQRAYRLIDAILDYSKVGRNANQDTSFDLHEVVEEVFHVLHPPEHITFRTCQQLPQMVADKTRIRQVFQNLLGNAMSAIDKAQGKIEVDFQLRDQTLEFSISDNGMGIDERHFKKIFDIFQSLQSSTNPESTGIGLSIVKKVVELYKGKIWLESTLGEGTTFYMAWPIQIFPEYTPSSGVPASQEQDG